MCEPQDDNEAFIPYSLLFDNLQDCLLTYDQLSECGDLFAGLDIARVGHLSVLYIVEKIQEKLVTRYILTMQNETFPNQLRQIKKILTMPNVRRLALDYTGMGIGIGDDLTENYPLGMIDCITFTPKAKQELGFRIRNLLQDKAFALPNDQIILEDFHSIKKINSATHTIRLVSEENKETSSHSDYFWAAALAGHSASSDSYIAINEKSIKSIASQVWLGTKKILQGFDKTIDRT
jgi:phage FluMu gp28-like protein